MNTSETCHTRMTTGDRMTTSLANYTVMVTVCESLSHLIYLHALVPKVLGRINETCGLVRHLIKQCIKLVPIQNDY